MQVVSQVSLPMRIALAATLAFLAVWFVALRPKPIPPSAAAPPAAAQSAPGKAVEQAQQGVAAQQQAAQAAEQTDATSGTEAAAPGAAASPATKDEAAPAKPGAPVDLEKAAGKNVSKAAVKVLRDVEKGRVAVLMFWDRRLSDDRAVHRAVKGLDRRGGKVTVHVAPIAALADFEPITRGVPVVTSPTVLVIDRAGRARSVGGLSVPSELEELVGKALKVKR
jgi:hypothetical protein